MNKLIVELSRRARNYHWHDQDTAYIMLLQMMTDEEIKEVLDAE